METFVLYVGFIDSSGGKLYTGGQSVLLVGSQHRLLHAQRLRAYHLWI